MLVFLSISAVADNFTMSRFECDTSTAPKGIIFITFVFVIFILWVFALWTKIPILNIIFGLVTCYFAWNVSKCFFMANVLFILMGLLSMGYGIIFIGDKDKLTNS